jgi:hypothetical protein
MGEEILSVAIFESLPGKDKEAVATLRELFAYFQPAGTAGMSFIAMPKCILY